MLRQDGTQQLKLQDVTLLIPEGFSHSQSGTVTAKPDPYTDAKHSWEVKQAQG